MIISPWKQAASLRPNWAHPITKGLTFLLPFAEGGGFQARDVVRGKTGTLDSGMLWQPTAKGRGVKGDGGGTQVGFSGPIVQGSLGTGLGDFTLFVIANPASEATARGLIHQRSPTGSNFSQCGIVANMNASFSASAGTLTAVLFSSLNMNVSFAGGIDGHFHAYCFARQSDKVSVWVDARPVASATNANILGIDTVQSDTVAAAGSGTHDLWPGTHHTVLAAAWNRALSQAEVIELQRNPWILFQPRLFGLADGPASDDLEATGLAEVLGISDGQASASFSLQLAGDSAEVLELEDGQATDSGVSDFIQADADESLNLEDGIAAGLAGGYYGPKPLVLVRSGLDTGTDSVSDIPVNHPSWEYRPNVLTWGELKRELAIPPNYAITSSGSLELADSPDRVTGVQRYREEFHQVTQRRRPVTIKSGFVGGSEALFPTIYQGEFAPAAFPPDRVRLAFGDRWAKALDRPIPPLINRTNFPNLPAGKDSGFFPLVFGRCVSTTSTPSGVIPLTLVDTTTNDYAANQTTTREIVQLYIKRPDDLGWLIQSPSAYTVIEEDRTFGNVTHTLTFVRMNSALPEGTEVRADIDGVASRGQFGPIPAVGRGEDDETVSSIVDHIINLTYLMFQIDPVDAEFDYDSFAETRTYLEELGLAWAGAITKPMTFRAALAQMLFCGQVHYFQNRFAKYELRFAGISNPTAPLFTEHNDVLAHTRVKGSESAVDITAYQPDKTINQFKYSFAPNHNTSEFQGADVYDNLADQAELGLIEDEHFTLPFCYDAATARWAIEEAARYYALRSYHVEFSLSAPQNVNKLELAHLFRLSYYGGIGGAWDRQQFMAYSLTYLPSELRYVVRGMLLPTCDPPQEAAEIDGGWSGNSRVGPFYADCNIFGCFLDGRYPSTRLMVVAWDQDEESFIPQDDGAFPALAPIGSFDAHRVGGVLHIATQENTGRVAYHTFSLGLKQWTLLNEEVVASTSHGDLGVSITVRQPSGEVLINYQGDRVFIVAATSWWPSVDDYYQRLKFKRRLLPGTWSAEVDVGEPELAQPSFFFTSEEYGGRVRVITGRAMADNANRVYFLHGRYEPLDVASNKDFQVQTLQADNTLGANSEFQLGTGLGYSAHHIVGDYTTGQDEEDFRLIAPIKFYGPYLYNWIAGGAPSTGVPLSAGSVAEHALTAKFPAIAVKYLNGKLHILFASFSNSSSPMKMIYKTALSPFTAVTPPYDVDGYQAGDDFAPLGLQMVGMDVASIGGRTWLFVFYSEGGSAKYKAFDVADVITD